MRRNGVREHSFSRCENTTFLNECAHNVKANLRVLLPKLDFIWMKGGSYDSWEDSERLRGSMIRALRARAEFFARTGASSIRALALQEFTNIHTKGGTWIRDLRRIVPVVKCIDAGPFMGEWKPWDLRYQLVSKHSYY